jgi:hypothetical protein
MPNPSSNIQQRHNYKRRSCSLLISRCATSSKGPFVTDLKSESSSHSGRDVTIFGKVCEVVALQFREMGLWSGVNLGCLVFRYKKANSRRKNIWIFNFKNVCGVFQQEVGAIPHIQSESCDLYNLRYSLYFTSETIKIHEKALVISINQTQYFPLLRTIRENVLFLIRQERHWEQLNIY